MWVSFPKSSIRLVLIEGGSKWGLQSLYFKCRCSLSRGKKEQKNKICWNGALNCLRFLSNIKSSINKKLIKLSFKLVECYPAVKNYVTFYFMTWKTTWYNKWKIVSHKIICIQWFYYINLCKYAHMHAWR